MSSCPSFTESVFLPAAPSSAVTSRWGRDQRKEWKAWTPPCVPLQGKPTCTSAPCVTTTPRGTTTACGPARAARLFSRGVSKVSTLPFCPCLLTLCSLCSATDRILQHVFILCFFFQDTMTTSAPQQINAPSTRTDVKAVRPAACENATKLAWWSVVGAHLS